MEPVLAGRRSCVAKVPGSSYRAALSCAACAVSKAGRYAIYITDNYN